MKKLAFSVATAVCILVTNAMAANLMGSVDFHYTGPIVMYLSVANPADPNTYTVTTKGGTLGGQDALTLQGMAVIHPTIDFGADNTISITVAMKGTTTCQFNLSRSNDGSSPYIVNAAVSSPGNQFSCNLIQNAQGFQFNASAS